MFSWLSAAGLWYLDVIEVRALRRSFPKTGRCSTERCPGWPSAPA